MAGINLAVKAMCDLFEDKPWEFVEAVKLLTCFVEALG
jgi:hypothetical protein